MSPEPSRNQRDIATSIQVKFRCHESLKEKIDKSARDKEVSLSAEIVERLNSSFEDDRRHLIETALLGGSYKNARIVRGIAALMIIADPNESWDESKSQRFSVRMAINGLLESLMPMPDISEFNEEEKVEMAQRFAELQAVTSAYLWRLADPIAE